MEKEISNGAMLGIVLIALAAIIGLGFGVFAIAKGVANEGVTGVQENLDVVNSSAFTDYDQKIVTGTQVVSAIQGFEGKNVSILIATSSMKNAAVENKVSDGAGVSQAYSTKGSKVPGVYALASKEMCIRDSFIADVAINTDTFLPSKPCIALTTCVPCLLYTSRCV